MKVDIWLVGVVGPAAEVAQRLSESLGIARDQARGFVDAAPCRLFQDVPRERATATVAVLESAGANVEVHPAGAPRPLAEIALPDPLPPKKPASATPPPTPPTWGGLDLGAQSAAPGPELVDDLDVWGEEEPAASEADPFAGFTADAAGPGLSLELDTDSRGGWGMAGGPDVGFDLPPAKGITPPPAVPAPKPARAAPRARPVHDEGTLETRLARALDRQTSSMRLLVLLTIIVGMCLVSWPALQFALHVQREAGDTMRQRRTDEAPDPPSRPAPPVAPPASDVPRGLPPRGGGGPVPRVDPLEVRGGGGGRAPRRRARPIRPGDVRVH